MTLTGTPDEKSTFDARSAMPGRKSADQAVQEESLIAACRARATVGAASYTDCAGRRTVGLRSIFQAADCNRDDIV